MTNQTPWAELSDDQKRPYDDYVFSQCYFYADTHYSPATVEVLHRFAEHVYTHKTWQPPEHSGLAVVRAALDKFLECIKRSGDTEAACRAVLDHLLANGLEWSK